MIYQLLEKYWGYNKFRPLQEKIIQSVLSGKDTLALMPTGGGKSITYQISALAMEGVCLVVTPLIALMKDQVDALKSRGIKATMVYSGMTSEEIETNLTNCIFGDYKFLYLAPERLHTEMFRAKVQQMKICLLAIDEAHCISQWGYDFRPAYLKISELRALFPEVPVLAVTATATPEVAKDIQLQLKFKETNLLSTRFDRPNLAYLVRHTEDKLNYLLRIHRKEPGSGLIYVRNRRKTREVAQFLQSHGIKADFYHAGLSDPLRVARQNDWISGKTEVMVATNAFGMGIDKPDVRYVIHLDLPDSPEAYFQEAGRAGRDGKPSWAVLLFHPSDKTALFRRLESQFPEADYIREVYRAAGNFLQIPYGSGKDIPLDFHLRNFCSRYHLDSLKVFSALKILEREGYIQFQEDAGAVAKVLFTVSRDDLYRFQVTNARFDDFIKLILRSYTGLFSEYTPVYEQELAVRAKIPVETVYDYLNRLDALHIIRYIPMRNTPLFVYLTPRLETKALSISREALTVQKERVTRRVEAILRYAQGQECRNVTLLQYFGQKNAGRCGRCDVCMKKNDAGMTHFEFESIQEAVLQQLRAESSTTRDLAERISFSEEKVLLVIRWMLDQSLLLCNQAGKLEIAR